MEPRTADEASRETEGEETTEARSSELHVCNGRGFEKKKRGLHVRYGRATLTNVKYRHPLNIATKGEGRGNHGGSLCLGRHAIETVFLPRV